MGQEAKPRAWTEWRLLFLSPGARFLVVSKLVELHLPPRRSETSPHPWALCLWRPLSFLDRRVEEEEEEEVWTIETMAVIEWKMT